MVLLAQAWSLMYQSWIHTERIGSFQGAGERVRYGLTQNIRAFSPIRAAFTSTSLWGET